MKEYKATALSRSQKGKDLNPKYRAVSTNPGHEGSMKDQWGQDKENIMIHSLVNMVRFASAALEVP